jgi:hypothetical protein
MSSSDHCRIHVVCTSSREALEIVSPARSREHASNALHAAVCLQVHAPLPHLDTRSTVRIEPAEELVLAVDGNAPQLHGLGHLQSPALCQAPLQRVVHGVALPVEVEPPGAGERELVRRRILGTARSLVEAHASTRLHEIGGEVFPRLRQPRLLWVDAGHLLHVDDSQLVACVEDPDLVTLPGHIAQRLRDGQSDL